VLGAAQPSVGTAVQPPAGSGTLHPETGRRRLSNGVRPRRAAEGHRQPQHV